MVPEQQAAAPPGRPLQPVPPQLPQLAAQHTLPFEIPELQVSSDCSHGFSATCCCTAASWEGLRNSTFGQSLLEQ
jgi:hypothetical protein